MTFNQHLLTGTQHIQQSDPILEKIIRTVGTCKIDLQKDYYKSLVASIVSQQISVKAANSIRARFMDLIDHNLEPSEIRKFDLETLRTAGLSKQKSSYILDLSNKFFENPEIYHHLEDLDDKLVIEHLTEVKGIGEWTAHMFLMFSLGRLNVLPIGDIGFQNAVMKHYNLNKKPDKKTIQNISKPWDPYCSIAVWYLWEITDQQ